MSWEPQFRPRAALFGDVVPTNSNGTPRPPIKGCRYLTLHYTGVTSTSYADFGDSPDEIRSIQAYAVNAKKPWEYNYAVDTEGVVWEYAGTYQAAHSAGENLEAIGVILLLGVNEAPTERMIDAVRWLRWVLVAFQTLRPYGQHEVRPHKDMPGAATPCPGQLVLARWESFTAPWIPAPSPAPAPEAKPASHKWLEPDCRFTLQAGDSPWGVARIAYGTGTRYPELVARNPGTWTVGRQVVVPGASGAGFRVRPGDSPWSILADIWPNESPAKRLETFIRWNGGASRVLRPGDVVYAPYEVMR